MSFHSFTTTMPSDDGMTYSHDYSYDYYDYSYTEHFVRSSATLRHFACSHSCCLAVVLTK